MVKAKALKKVASKKSKSTKPARSTATSSVAPQKSDTLDYPSKRVRNGWPL